MAVERARRGATVAAIVGGVVLLVGGGVALLAPEAFRRGGGSSGGPTPATSGARDPAEAATAGGGTLKGRAPPARAPAEGEPVDLSKVDRERDLHGLVVDEDGAAVAGATLVAVVHPWRRTNLLAMERYDVEVEVARTKSARDGSFALRLRPGERVSLHASAPGYAPVESSQMRAGERVRVVLPRGAAVVVVATEERGRPAVDVVFRLFRPEHRGDVAFDRRARTDADGRARFDALPPGASAWLDQEESTYGDTGWKQVQVPERGEATVSVVLPAGRTLRGRVTDAETGAPVESARVGMNWTLHRPVSTDARGAYALPGWTGEGIQDVHVLADGYARGQAKVGDLEVLDFALVPGVRVVGRVLSAGGDPVADAVVSAKGSRYSEETGGQSSGANATSGADGRFALSGLAPGWAHAVVFLSPGHARYVLDLDAPASKGEVDLGDVRLPVPRTISGRFLASDGAPIARATVTCEGANADRGRLRPGVPPLDEASEEDTRTDDLGRFVLVDLAPGTYALSAQAEGLVPVERTVRVPDDADVTGLELRAPPTRPFRLVVVDQDGVPAPGVWVYVTGSNGLGHGVSLDAQGVAEFPLAHGEATILVSAYAFLSADERRFVPEQQEFAVEAGASERRCVLVLGSSVAGRVVSADGKPVPRAGVEAVRSGEVVATGSANEAGEFDVTVPRGDPLVLRLDGSGVDEDGRGTKDLGLAGEKADVATGSTGVVVVARARSGGRRQVVRVVDPEGRGVRGARVVPAWARGVSSGPSRETDDAGTVEVTDLPDAPVDFEAEPPAGTPFLGASVSAVPGTEPLEVRLGRGLRLRGTVSVPEGVRPEDVRVKVVQGTSSLMVSRTVSLAADGSFDVALDPDYGRRARVLASLGPQDAPTHTAEATVDDVESEAATLVLTTD